MMINEVYTNHGVQVSESAMMKLFNSIVKIVVSGGQGTGFFLRFTIRDQPFFSLFTNFHVIPKYLVDSKSIIDIYYGPKEFETRAQIRLDPSQRFIRCFAPPKDVTVVQILQSDNIPENKYLLPELNYKNLGGFNFYLNCDFYLAGYPSVDDVYKQFKGERHLSSGKILQVFNYFEFNHSLDTRCGSSGSPICLISNQGVIGIHKSGIKSNFINQGTFIGVILD